MKIDDKTTTQIQDVKQLGIIAAIASLSYVFWIVGAMEMVERLAYYGVKAVAALYATAPKSEGGLGVTEADFGRLLVMWALVQSFLPVITGSLSDRFGYKETIFASTVIKILGYITMAALNTYWGFYLGAVILAAGTAVFKPGIQGTLVLATNRQNSSMAWGIFYQTVNIGGFLGPLVASYMRSNFSWTMVFIACAIIISLNFVLLLTYREVGREERMERRAKAARGELKQKNLLIDSLQELRKPHLFVYLMIFSGFWFMFNSLFDVLPLHIRDWVDRSDIMAIFPNSQTDNSVIKFFLGMNEDGTNIDPEGVLNLNAGMIMITCFLFAYLSGLMRATTSMLVGTFFASISLFAAGNSTTGWIMIAAIALFSVGEMLSSPKFLEFIGNFAPKNKKAMYLGFSQMPLAIGWTLEGYLGPALYGMFASKDKFSRQLLAERMEENAAALPVGGQTQAWSDGVQSLDMPASFTSSAKSPAQDLAAKLSEEKETVTQIKNTITDADGVASQGDKLNSADIMALAEQPDEFTEHLPQGEAFDWLVLMTGDSPSELTDVMHAEHNIAMVWYIMGGVGILTTFGIYVYGQWIKTIKTDTES